MNEPEEFGHVEAYYDTLDHLKECVACGTKFVGDHCYKCDKRCLHCGLPATEDFYCSTHAEEFALRTCNVCGTQHTGKLCFVCRCPLGHRMNLDTGLCPTCLRRDLRHALFRPAFVATIVARWALVGMCAAIGAQAGPATAALCAIVGLEFGTWMASKILTADPEDK